MNIRYPNITAQDAMGKLTQIQSYLHQLVDVLNQGLGAQEQAVQQKTAAITQKMEKMPSTAGERFEEMKALIIKSADIVSAYAESIGRTLQGEYVAQSDFGQFKATTEAVLSASDKQLAAILSTEEQISGELNGIKANVGSLSATASSLDLYYRQIYNDGVERVSGKGYRFDKDGLLIYEEGKTIKNLLDHEGMRVSRYRANGEKAHDLLVANKDGVEATDVKVNNYLIVGENSRFEDYKAYRTGCFYVNLRGTDNG